MIALLVGFGGCQDGVTLSRDEAKRCSIQLVSRQAAKGLVNSLARAPLDAVDVNNYNAFLSVRNLQLLFEADCRSNIFDNFLLLGGHRCKSKNETKSTLVREERNSIRLSLHRDTH